jgi:hypothetical protein
MNIYRLKVTLLGVPPWATDKTVWRTIEMKGNQTLEQLHKAIFKAFDRFDEHLYSFYMTKNRRDPMQEYASPYLFEDDDFDLNDRPHSARGAKLDKLELRVRQKFYYTFDYGDDWEHVVQVLSVKDEEPVGRYPRISERHGESPEQYGEWDEDEEEDGEEDDEEGASQQTGPGRVIPLYRDRNGD